jgi:hypothetical protein
MWVMASPKGEGEGWKQERFTDGCGPDKQKNRQKNLGTEKFFCPQIFLSPVFSFCVVEAAPLWVCG